MKNLDYLLKAIDVKNILNYENRKVTSVQYDSRKVSGDCLFVALRGSVTDGHNFITQAIRCGARTIVCEELPANVSEFDHVSFILTENTRVAHAKLAHCWYDYPSDKLDIIGVTGTNGKTTITYLLKNVLEKAGIPTGIIGTTGIFFGNEFISPTHTTPESLELAYFFRRMADSGIKAVAMEVSSHALHQHRTDSISFNSAIFTNLTHEHLDYHKTMDEYADAKKILFKSLPADGIAVVFNNSPYSEKMLDGIEARQKILIGRENSDLILLNEKTDYKNSTFSISGLDKILAEQIADCDFETSLIGSFNIENAALVAALLILKGFKPEFVKAALAEAKGAPGRMQRFVLKNGALGIVDYAHTPDALEKALNACRGILKGNGRLISVFGCGGDRDKTKRPEMGEISSRLADFTFVTSDNPRTEEPEQIISDILTGIVPENMDKCLIQPDRSKAIADAIGYSKDGDIILVAGKGHENYQIIGKTKIHFDDSEELRKYQKN